MCGPGRILPEGHVFETPCLELTGRPTHDDN